MKNICLHIGIPKAASTTLQHEVFSRHSQLNYLGKPFFKDNQNHSDSLNIDRLSRDISASIRGDSSLEYDQPDISKRIKNHY